MPRPKGSTNKPKTEKKVTRYTYEDIREPRTPETGHTPLLPAEEQVVTLPMDNGWSKAVHVGRLPEGDERPVVVDMDPAADPVLFWAGKRNRRQVPVLPLQRNEIVSESRIAQIIERARKNAEEKSGAAQQGHLFADLEKTLRESDKGKRVEFYTHEEGWKNKLICGDSLHVMESLLHYENLRGKVQMIYIDPPYGIKYDSNFQQRVDSTKNDEKDQADDVLTIKAFRDTWALGVHSYLSYLQDRALPNFEWVKKFHIVKLTSHTNRRFRPDELAWPMPRSAATSSIPEGNGPVPRVKDSLCRAARVLDPQPRSDAPGMSVPWPRNPHNPLVFR